MEFSEKFLGPSDAISINLNNIYQKAKNEIDSKFEATFMKIKRREKQEIERARIGTANSS